MVPTFWKPFCELVSEVHTKEHNSHFKVAGFRRRIFFFCPGNPTGSFPARGVSASLSSRSLGVALDTHPREPMPLLGFSTAPRTQSRKVRSAVRSPPTAPLLAHLCSIRSSARFEIHPARLPRSARRIPEARAGSSFLERSRRAQHGERRGEERGAAEVRGKLEARGRERARLSLVHSS